MGLRHSFAFLRTVASSFAVLADRERLQAGRCFPMCLSVAGSRFTALWVALTGRVPGAQWTRLHFVDETIFMCGIYDYRARRVLFAVQLQDRGEHRARYVTAHETFENVVITLFDFEQGTDANYHDCITSYFYSARTPRTGAQVRCAVGPGPAERHGRRGRPLRSGGPPGAPGD